MDKCISAPVTVPANLQDVIQKQVFSLKKNLQYGNRSLKTKKNILLEEAYSQCGRFCAQHGSNFYLGTFLLTPERRKAAWAIHAWGMRADDIVDDPNTEDMDIKLEQWEKRLEYIFAGQPSDILDMALADTVSKYNLDIQPFREIIQGMKLDLVKSRYENFEELYQYCYYVAGTAAIMLLPVLGISPESHPNIERICHSALCVGVATQLTNILRDVAEDGARGRIYLPQDELRAFGLCEEDILQGQVTEKWRIFVKEQIRRANIYFNQADDVVSGLDKCSKWPVCASILIYKQILDAIEANGYDNLSKRIGIPKWKKFASLSVALLHAIV